jgi:hypothetical protein
MLTQSHSAENATNRQQYSFPASAPLPPPGQRPFPGSRHGVHASISGPIGGGSPNGFRQQPPSPYRQGPPAAGNRMPIPPFNGGSPAPPDPFARNAQPSPSPMSQQPLPPQIGNVTQQPTLSNTPPPASNTPDQLGAGARRPGRRQYARDAGAYLAGDGSGPPPGAGHGHSQSVAGSFFSPAAPALAPAGGAGQFFTPGGGDAAGAGFGAAPVQPGPGGAPAPAQPIGGAPSAAPAGFAAGAPAQLANQFGQMGLGGPRQQANVANLNLIQTPLNPLELFTLQPPEINLPPNVSFLFFFPSLSSVDVLSTFSLYRPPSPSLRLATPIPPTSA